MADKQVKPERIKWKGADLRGVNAAPTVAAAHERDGMPTSEEWTKLQAEWAHDYGLRRLEDRGVKYEDEADRTLDHAAAGGMAGEQNGPRASGIAEGQATATTPGREAKPATQPRQLWPSEIAKANREKQARQDHAKSNGQDHGRDDGHSM